MKFRKIKQHGQVLVFYALLVPLLLLFAAVGMDLGWYYLNVSRMQNAADAAAVAGAWKLLGDEETLSDYNDVLLIDFVPAHFLKDPKNNNLPIISTRSKAVGDVEAKDYVKKNLAPNGTWDNNTIPDSYDKRINTLTFDSQLYGRGYDEELYGIMCYQVILEEDVKHFFMSGWFEPMKAKVQAVAKITPYARGPNLFEQTKVIAERETYETWDHIRAAKYNVYDEPQYDKIPEPTLTEEELEAYYAAKGISENDIEGREAAKKEAVEEARKKAWEAAKKKAKDNANLKARGEADARSVLSTGNKYKAGYKNRIEVLRLNGQGGENESRNGNPYTTKGKTNQRGYDDLFIDWQGDMAKMTTEDLDLGVKGAKSDPGKNWSHYFETNKNLESDTDLQRRIHGLINFEPDPDADGKFPYPVRDADFYKNENNKKALEALLEAARIDGRPYVETGDALIEKIAKESPDPLYARIESEPVHDGSGFQTDSDGNVRYDDNGKPIRKVGDKGHSVRQIIINLNVANNSDRPVFFYYTGPEKVSDYDKRVPDEHVRDSLPVIINFNADFRGIFFFPNSPVVINGNEKKFEGYVIAKEYVMLKKYEDGDFLYDETNKVYYDRSILLENFHGEKVKDSSDYQKVTVDGQTKYILKNDLENYSPADSNFETVKHNSFYYKKGEVGTAEELAYASGNGKVSYYSTNDKNGADESWTTKVGEGYFDHSLTKRFVYFPKSYVTEKNWSYTGAKSVWRAKEILPDGSEGDWLDKREDAEYKDRYMVNWGNDKVILYSTAEELLNKLDGYNKLDDNTWEKTGATSYMKITTEDEKIYYIPIDDNIHLRDGEEPTFSNTVLVKYRDGDTEKTVYANLSDDPEKYYLMYQDDYDGKPTTNNPMFVDELGNVQYKKNADGSYKEVTPSKTATSLIYQTSIKARDDGVNGNKRYAKGTDGVEKLLYKTTIIEKNGVSNEYVTEVTNSDGTLKTLSSLSDNELISTTDSEGKFTKYDKNEANIVYTQAYERGFDPSLRIYEEESIESKYPFLEEEISQSFFDKNQFNLATSRFDNFQLVKMTEYRYLNSPGNQRSLDNFFTSDRSTEAD